MAARIVVCLLCVFITFVETTVRGDPYTMITYDCKALYWFAPDTTPIHFRNSTYGIDEIYSEEQLPALITIPANASVHINIEMFSSNVFYTSAMQISPVTCCSENVTIYRNCRTLSLSCPEKCVAPKWLNFPDFYKTMDCDNCTCQYCYIGNGVKRQQFSVVTGGRMHLFDERFSNIIKLIKIIQPRKDLSKPFQLPLTPNTDLLPLPQDGPLKRYFKVTRGKGFLNLNPIANESLPENGRIQIYFEEMTNSTNVTNIIEYNIKWYSPLNCSIVELPVSYLNDPWMAINCVNAIQEPIIYNVTNSKFQMWENKLYLKVLTTEGDHNITITAMYKDQEDSQFTVKVDLKIADVFPASSSFAAHNGCEIDININLLNYTSLLIKVHYEFGRYSGGHEIVQGTTYLTDLQADGTNTFEIRLNGRPPQLYQSSKPPFFTFTVINKPRTCCYGEQKAIEVASCFELKLECPQSCEVTAWPEYKGFHKISSSGECSSRYCYTGFDNDLQRLVVPLKTTTYTFLVFPKVSHTIHRKFVLPRERFFTPMKLNSCLDCVYLLENASSHQYFQINSINNSHSLLLKDRGPFPLNGRTRLYIWRIQPNNCNLREDERKVYDIIWYSPLRCNASLLQAQYINDPMLEMQCENSSQLPITYNTSSAKFVMRENKVYLKDLTARGQFNLSITALNDLYPLTATTVNVSFEVPANSTELLSVYECKAVFNFNLLNYSRLNIQNQQLGFSLNLTDRPSFYIIDLPPNKTTNFQLFFNNQTALYTITVTSSDCCGLISKTDSPTCFHLNFTCGDACGISTWPDPKNYYKFSECKGCGCSYCYIGETGGTKNLSVSGKSHTYNWTIQILPITQRQWTFVLPRTSIVPTFSHFQAPPFPAPWGSFLQTNYDFNSSIPIYTIKPEKVKMIPRDDTFTYYAGNISGNNIELFLVKVSWYSPLLCNVFNLPWKHLNDPLLSIDCKSGSLRPNVFNVSHPKFVMRENKVYLKDLTARGQFNLSITALNDLYPLTATTVNVSFEVPANSTELLSVYECKAVFNFNLLNYSRLNIQNQQLGFSLNLTDRPSFYIIDLPPNKTTNFQLFFNNQTALYTSTVTSSDCCGLISKTDSPTCFYLSFSCGDACGISTWPDPEDYYKFSECKGCGCSYCYIGETGGTKDLSVSGKSHTYNWTIHILPITQRQWTFVLPRTSIAPTFSHFPAPPYPAPWGSFLQTNYDFNSSIPIYTIKPEKAKMISRDGTFNYYAGNISGNNIELFLVKVSWYSPLLCNVFNLPWKHLNDPLLSIDCKSGSLRPNVFNFSHPKFVMRENKVYLKDLTARGQFNLSITALNDLYPLTATTVNVSFEVPANSTELLSVYECKAVFNFNLLNYSRLNIQNQQLGFSLNLTDRPSFYIIDLPPNRTTNFQLFFNNQTTLYTITVTSSDCCGLMSTTDSPTCFHLSFSCGDACGISTWPDPEDYYKFSECKGCGCSYCYIGETGGTKNISVSGKSHTYNWMIQILPITQRQLTFVLPRTSIVPTFSHFPAPPYPAPWGSLLQTNYDFNSSIPIYTIKPEKAKMIPRDDTFNYYAGNISGNNIELFLVMVSWYSPLLCNVFNLPWKQLNDPLLSIDCKSESLRPNVFNVSHPKFVMRENKVYLKDLTARGQFNLSITALNDLYPLTATTVNVSFEVDQIFITKLAAVKDKDRYIFTCYTNSTFSDMMYEWYWNEFKVSAGLSTSIQNGNSQGKFVFDGLSEKESGNLTCTATRKGFYISATIIKQMNTEDFPVVELDTTSNIIKNGIPVVVNCDVFQKYKNSKLVLKVNNQQQNESKVSISKEATVSCYAENDFRRGEMKTLQIYVAIGKKNCPAETQNNINWPETIVDTTVKAACIGDLSGNVIRSCSKDGNWEPPGYSKCVKKSILKIKSTLNRIASIGGNVAPVMEQLANSTEENMEAQDISETINALDVVSSITNNSEQQVSKKEVQSFADVVSNLVGEDTEAKWETLQKDNNLTAASMLKTVDDFGSIVSQKINETVSITTKNLVLELQRVDVNKNIQFPSPNTTQPKWVEESNTGIVVPSEVLENTFGANKTVAMNAVLFKNMKDLLPKSRTNNNTINSYILAMSLGKELVNLTENVSLTFSHLSKTGFIKSSCNFWDFKKSPEFGGSWSTQGCVLKSSNASYTVCSCDHLTNFAILMKPGPYKERKVIGIITIVGCSISILALVLTIIIYGICWKYVTSQDVTRSQSILLMNVCVSLIIGYMLFLILVKETAEKIACTVIASLIHYFFLVSFFAMLSEGIDMAIALTVIFTSKYRRLRWFIALIWGGPLIIVTTTLAITQTEGFGNDQFCWLTSENNVNLAFIIPVLIIVATNIICVIYVIKALLSAFCMLRESVKERLRSGARAIGILTPIMGFSWVFGVFAINEDLVAFEYIFAVANSLQGFFIFLTHCVFSKQIRKNIWKSKKITSLSKSSSSNSRSKTKSTQLNFSRKTDISNEYLRESSDIRQSVGNERLFRDMSFSDDKLKMNIEPYYMNLGASRNNDKTGFHLS